MKTAADYNIKPGNADNLAAFNTMCGQLRPGDGVAWDPGVYTFGRSSGDTIDWQKVPRRIRFYGFGGTGIKVLWSALALSFPLLATSGVIIWWRRVVL